MNHILISGLVNLETTARVRQFPIDYYPIDYPFFGVETAVSGVALNLALALRTLGDRVTLLSMTGGDMAAQLIRQTLREAGIGTEAVLPCLRETPNSVVLYDGDGQRQIYCDLKDLQEASYNFEPVSLDDVDLVAACNTNFNRPLLRRAKEAGKPIATDVHVLTDLHDGYNRDFMASADILFLSDEGVGEDYRSFLEALARTYGNQIIVLGRGSRGAAMYLRETGEIYALPAAHAGPVVNTVGAGDALFSGFLHFYAKGLPPLEALSHAQRFAAAKIRVSGAAKGFVTETELESLWP
ncbi:MAG: carbohydrate kinase family protein [Faecousia sp.]